MYSQRSEFIVREYIESQIELEYGITSKPITLVNPTYNEILERIHQVLGNLLRTFNITQAYFDRDDPWRDILCAAEFSIHSTQNMLKGYILSQLMFGHTMILSINHEVYWGLTH